MMPTDLVLTAVRLADGRGPFDVLIADGRVTDVVPSGGAASVPAAAERVDGTGRVVVPGLMDAHCHLDQSLMLADWSPIPESVTFLDKIHAAERLLISLTDPPLVERAAAFAWSMVANGTVAARSHASITPAVGLAGVEALLAVRERLAGSLRLQVVAFPQFGTRDPAVRQLMDEAMSLGCNVVGGMDPGLVDRDIEASLAWSFGLAERYDTPVDIHVHDPGLLGLYELNRLAAWTVRTSMQGRVVASHALCLGELDEDAIAATLEHLADAEVAVVSTANPNAAMPRPVELGARGVRFGLGSDTAHTSAPFGTSDMLKKANLVAQRHTYVTDAQLLTTLETASRMNGAILGVPVGEVQVGSVADLVVVGARTGAEAVASPSSGRVVIVGGRVRATRQ
jgi:cytosine deaminase